MFGAVVADHPEFGLGDLGQDSTDEGVVDELAPFAALPGADEQNGGMGGFGAGVEAGLIDADVDDFGEVVDGLGVLADADGEGSEFDGEVFEGIDEGLGEFAFEGGGGFGFVEGGAVHGAQGGRGTSQVEPIIAEEMDNVRLRPADEVE